MYSFHIQLFISHVFILQFIVYSFFDSFYLFIIYLNDQKCKIYSVFFFRYKFLFILHSFCIFSHLFIIHSEHYEFLAFKLEIPFEFTLYSFHIHRVNFECFYSTYILYSFCKRCIFIPIINILYLHSIFIQFMSNSKYVYSPLQSVF